MHTETYKVKGMHCASCAGIIEKTVKTVGVHSAHVNYGTETAKIVFDESKVGPQQISQTIEKLGYSLSTKRLEKWECLKMSMLCILDSTKVKRKTCRSSRFKK